jgi:hypothetical protein
MGSTLHIQTKVLPGGKIEVEAPELEVGDYVDVFVVPPTRTDIPRLPIREVLAHIRATIPPGDPEEMDRRWRDERDAWDR